jgi:hypothetical protein
VGELSLNSKLQHAAASLLPLTSGSRFAAIFAVCLVVCASPAGAQVMEVAADGTVSVRSGAGAATWQVMTPAPEQGTEDAEAPQVPASAITTTSNAMIPQQYSAAVQYAAASANISPTLLAALVWQESRWHPQAVSSKGAMGLTQLMPGTARDLGVDRTDPYANLVGGARYLRQLLNQFGGDVEKALAAYNAGPGRVRSAGGVPAIAETRNYVASIVRRISIASSGGTP